MRYAIFYRGRQANTEWRDVTAGLRHTSQENTPHATVFGHRWSYKSLDDARIALAREIEDTVYRLEGEYDAPEVVKAILRAQALAADPDMVLEVFGHSHKIVEV